MSAAFLNRSVRQDLATLFVKSAAELTLRPATKEDMPKVLKLEVSVFSQPWNEPTFLDMMGKGQQFWVVETQDKEIAGYAVFGPCADPKEIQLLTIAAAPGWRRQGVGHQLLRKVVDFAEESKANKISLVVRIGNYAAQKLYREFGFTPVFVYPHYYADNDESGVIMERPVLPGTKTATPEILDGPDKTHKKLEVQGIPVNIERPKGAIRLFPDKTTQFYKNDYGSIPRTRGVDGDPVDVFVGPDKGSKRVFVVDKMDDKNHGKFDEHKLMLGFKDQAAAREAAKFHLWGTDGKIHEIPLGKLQAALGVEKKAAEFAPGIPEKGRFVSIPDIQKPVTWEFAVQKHDAARAGCFSADTQITMADGSLRSISSVRAGDAVSTHRGVARVSRVWDNGFGDEWVEVLRGRSRTLCTPRHRFWVEGRGWVPAEEMDSFPYQEDVAAALRIRVFAEVPTDPDVRPQWAEEARVDEGAKGPARLGGSGAPCRGPVRPVPLAPGAVPEAPHRGDARKVLRVRRLPRTGRRRYDLEVEGHGCYIADGFLVHNSHFDLRLGDPTTGEAHSWAMKKLPRPGKSTYAPMQPTHTVSYMDFKGEIPSGYGAGMVDLARRGKAEVVSANENEVRFNVFEGRIPEQFALKRVPSQDGRMWVIHNVTPSRHTRRWRELIPADKPSMRAVKFKELDPAKPGTAWQPKLDGAHAIGVIEAGKPLKVFSYREAKNETGLIEHTHKMPDYWKNVAPKGVRPTVVRGELIAVDKKGKPLPVNEISGLLNAGTVASREVQKQKGVRLRFMAFDVDRMEGKKIVKMPYTRTQEILEDLSKQIPGLSVMPTVYDEAGKIKLKKQIGQHKHLLTREGIVERDVATGAAIKGKEEEPHDVFIREIYAGTKPGEAGGFRFSHTEFGPIVGNVGSGLSRADRRKMLKHPEQWVGRVAKVTAQQQLPSGALRMPIFHGFHESKGLQPYHEIASGGM